MTKADNIQIDGSHYKNSSSALKGVQHWTWCYHNNYDIFQVYITKYVHRHKEKNGIRDLKKARHTLDKYIEVLEEEASNEAYEIGRAERDRMHTKAQEKARVSNAPFSEDHFNSDLVTPTIKVSGVPYEVDEELLKHSSPYDMSDEEIAYQELQGKVHAREAQ